MTMKLIILAALYMLKANVDLFVAATLQSEFVINRQCITSAAIGVDKGSVRSQIKCAIDCSNDPTCDGFAMIGLQCYHLNINSLPTVSCSASDKFHFFLKKQCWNNGIYDANNKVCKCVDTWIGDFCERRPFNCEELKVSGYPDGFYKTVIDLHRNGSRLVNFRCWIALDRVYTYIFSNYGRTSLNKTMREYIDGYDLELKDFFMGLENLWWCHHYYYNLTRVIAEFRSGSEHIQIINYNVLRSINASHGYALSVHQSHQNETSGDLKLPESMTFQDLLYQSHQVPFSTYDSDSDLDGRNCAALSGSGWWFRNCDEGINPFGLDYSYKKNGSMWEYMRFPGIDTTYLRVNDINMRSAWAFYTSN